MSDIDLPCLIKLSNEQERSSFFVNPDIRNVTEVDVSICSNHGKSESILSNSQLTKKKCFACNRRLNLITEFLCKCDQQFCSKHKYPDMHSCQFDHKAIWKKSLDSKNPTICCNKIEKI